MTALVAFVLGFWAGAIVAGLIVLWVAARIMKDLP